MLLVRLVVFLLVCLCVSLQAADPTGTIAGTVQDPSGSAVPNARVTATALATGFTRETMSKNDGGYVFPLLPVGAYSVTVEVSGFNRFEQRGIVVQADQNSTVPIVLKIGSSSQSVTVESNAEMVQTRSGALSKVITQRNIVELPLNGRNAASLILLSPGTVDTNAGNGNGSGDTQQTVSYPGAQSISSNGGRADMVNYNLDGGSNQDHYTNVNNPFPNPDAVQEFSVQTNSFSAEYGRGNGAIVNVVTKSGTNQFHGSAFDFLRNGDLNARNFFADKADQLKRNQFGGSLGGPILKDKLFFFGTYQGTQIRNISGGNSATVPTAAERTGDFSALSRQLVNPFTGVPYANNQIPQSDFAPASVKILQLVPQATTPDGVIHYTLPINDHENQFMGRVDYNMAKHRIYGRYFYSRYGRDPIIGSQNIISSGRGFDLWDQGVSVSDTYSISSNILNSLIFSYNRNDGTILSGAPFSFSSLGIPIAGTDPTEIQLSVSGFFAISSGHPGQFNRHNYHVSDSLHWVVGSHEIAIGGDFMRMDVDITNTYRQNGDFRFTSTQFSGSPLSDFLLGYTQRFIQGGGEFAARRGNLGSLFFQDNYRASKDLVLNLGLRWDPFIPYHDEKGRTECFLPGLQSTRFTNSPGGYVFAGDPGCPDGGFLTSWKQLAPRFGFAYNVGGRGRTTVRGGWGMFYQPPFVEAFNNMVDSAPFSPQVQMFGVPFMNPYQGSTNPFPAQYGPRLPASDVAFDLPLSLAVSYQHNWKPSQAMNWNLTVEHQLSNDILMRVGYVGSKGTHLAYNTDVNAPLPSPDATADNEDARRPYQQFLQITQDQSNANSSYHSFQADVDKRFSHGITVSANYTWSRTIDPVSYQTDLCGINIINPYDINAYRGVSDFNVPHRFVLNYLWQLPSPKHGIEKVLLGGWETSAIWSWQSGFPLNVTSGGDYSFSLPENSNDQAQVVATPHYTQGSLAQKINQWFTTDAFTTPNPNTFGNAGRNILIGPGTFNIDFSAHKVFALTERFNLQYRAEFFNLLNHTQLNNPDTSVPDDTFGRITSARDPRIIQMALKLVF